MPKQPPRLLPWNPWPENEQAVVINIKAGSSPVVNCILVNRCPSVKPDLSFDKDTAFVMLDCWIRDAVPEDQAAAYYVCLKTGDHGRDGEPFYQDDPDALGRIFVGPYLALEPELSLVLEDAHGVCGYALGTLDSRLFYDRYERLWRPELCRQFPMPEGDPQSWSRAQFAHSLYHQPDYFCPQPYDHFPSHMHIDLLERARGLGFGRKMMQEIMDRLTERGSPGAHLGVSVQNSPAIAFYLKLGFQELTRVGNNQSGCVYLGKRFP